MASRRSQNRPFIQVPCVGGFIVGFGQAGFEILKRDTAIAEKTLRRTLQKSVGHSASRLAQDTPLPPYQITVPRLELINARLLVFPFAIATALAGNSHSPTPPGPGSEQNNWPFDPYSVMPPKVPIAVIRSVPRLPAGSSRHPDCFSFGTFSFAVITGAVCFKEAAAALASAGSTEPEALTLSDGPFSDGSGWEHATVLTMNAAMAALAKIRIITRLSFAQEWDCAG